MENVILYITLLVIIALTVFVIGREINRQIIKVARQRELRTIFTNITHELLTPLTVVSASVDHLREEAPAYDYDYNVMQLNIQRMVRLLQQILETSRAEAGELKLKVAQGDVMRYIHETALCMEPLMRKKDMRFSVKCQPESMMGWIDTDKLDKIVYNLLSNAAKYTDEHGEVALRVSTNSTYDHISIRVSDTGSGLSEAQQKRLFQRFYDGDYRSHETIGNGLGLAITRDLVALHGGTIACDSQKGHGTTFTVSLPINKESFAADQIDEEQKDGFTIPQQTIVNFKAQVPDVNSEALLLPTGEGAAGSVLIVEDNVELLMLMKQWLKSHYRVLTAINGRKALEVLGKTRVDLVVTDVMMPQMDGYELTRAIRSNAQHSSLPVLMLTARTHDEDRKEALLAGADDFLSKPFRLSDLRQRIDSIITGSQQPSASMAQTGTAGTAETKHKPTAEELFLEKARQCVLTHLDDPDYDRDSFAADMNAGGSSLYNKVRAITGSNVVTFIRHIRMAEAQRIAAEDPTIRISDLAWRVGFRDPKYFATIFKRQFGLTPREYIDSLAPRENVTNVEKK